MSIIPSESTACDKVFTLPEICGRISQLIDRKTLTTCLCVNHSWNSSWLPILWHTIDAGRYWNSDTFKDSLGKHGDLVRILKFSRHDEIDPLFRMDSVICRNLVNLTLPNTTPSNQSTHARLLRQNPNIRYLSILILEGPITSYTDLLDAFDSLPHLTKLSLDKNKIINASTLETILTKCNGSLQELSLNSINFILHPSFKSGEEFASGLMAYSESRPQPGVELKTIDTEVELKSTFGIQSLCLEEVTCSQDLILNLASRFPLLNRLSLKNSSEVYFSKDFAERLSKRSPKIKNFDISNIEDTDDDTITRIINSFPGIQTFQASDTRFGDFSLRALVNSCRDLTVLEFSSACEVSSRVIQQLLERCWSLKKLDAWDISANVAEMMVEAYRNDMTIGVSDAKSLAKTDGSVKSSYNASRGEWVCRGIESLALRFDYDSSTLSEDDMVYSTPNARRFVYEQLSRLTKLRNLVLEGAILYSEDIDEGDDDEKINDPCENVGADNKEIPDTLDGDIPFDIDTSIWIDFSIRSGLAQLGTLENLRTLSIRAHAIGVPEIIWMTKSWPNLSIIQGLDDDDDEAVIDWLHQNHPNIILEND